jgi:hypothetical protein
MTVVHLMDVDVGDQSSSLHLGYYLDQEGALRTVDLDYRVAVAVLYALSSGREWVSYDLDRPSYLAS